MMDWDGDWSGHSMTWGAWFGMTLVVLVVVLLAVALAEALTRGEHQTPPAVPLPPEPGSVRTPDRILDERFARGEIDEQEYRARRAALHAG